MIVLYVFLVALFSWPSIHALVRSCRNAEQKPAKTEVVGIIFITAVVAVFLSYLMYKNYFF